MRSGWTLLGLRARIARIRACRLSTVCGLLIGRACRLRRKLRLLRRARRRWPLWCPLRPILGIGPWRAACA